MELILSLILPLKHSCLVVMVVVSSIIASSHPNCTSHRTRNRQTTTERPTTGLGFGYTTSSYTYVQYIYDETLFEKFRLGYHITVLSSSSCIEGNEINLGFILHWSRHEIWDSVWFHLLSKCIATWHLTNLGLIVLLCHVIIIIIVIHCRYQGPSEFSKIKPCFLPLN